MPPNFTYFPSIFLSLSLTVFRKCADLIRDMHGGTILPCSLVVWMVENYWSLEAVGRFITGLRFARDRLSTLGMTSGFSGDLLISHVLRL